jgi:DNA-directed RNA polymerase specialized sigma24 family protein
MDRMYRCAFRLCGQKDDAQELVQETFLNTFQGLKDLLGHLNLTPILPGGRNHMVKS